MNFPLFLYFYPLLVTYLNPSEVVYGVKEKLRELELTQRIFAKGLFNQIGQEIFQFRPWGKSNEKYKKRIVKMYLWLNDPHGSQKLKDYDDGIYGKNLCFNFIFIF